jgi:hypothetical protein
MRAASIVFLMAVVPVMLAVQAKPAPAQATKPTPIAERTFRMKRSMGLGELEGTFTVSARGWQWSSSPDGHYHNDGVWSDIRTWSCSGEQYGFGLTLHHQTGVDSFRFRHDDLVEIVDNYLKRFAPDKLDPKEKCNPDG